jgi:Domain of unknown function (DUF4349)
MRWSDRGDDNLDAVLRGESETKLGTALAELREHKVEPSGALRERVRTIAGDADEREWQPQRKPSLLRRYRFRPAHLAAAAAAVLFVTVAMNGILALSNATDDESGVGPMAGAQAPPDAVERARENPDSRNPWADSGSDAGDGGGEGQRSAAPPPPPPPAAQGSAAPPPAPPSALQGGGFAAPAEQNAPLPSTHRAQDYSASIKLHVADHGELSEAVQSAIRTTRQLGGYVTYVDYGTSGKKDGRAKLAVRVPVGRVQTAVARFSELGTILEQQTEIVDLQGRIDRITLDIQRRRDRIAKLEAELKDPNLTDAERDRLEARLVAAKRGLANATSNRAGVLRQSRFAKLDLTFTTEEREEPAPPPSELRRTLDDAAGILAAELGVLLYVLIAGAPFIVLAILAWLGLRAGRRGAAQRVLERA